MNDMLQVDITKTPLYELAMEKGMERGMEKGILLHFNFYINSYAFPTLNWERNL
jgi:hypothetical protein